MTAGRLIFITGSPWVGKTTAARRLYRAYDNSAYCDGDWMWCVNPFSVDDPRLRNGDKNMSFVLSTYLNSGFDYVVFSSVVVVDREIRERILQDVTARDYSFIGFTLTCSEETLAERRKKRDGPGETNFYFLNLPPIPGDHVINTDGKSPAKVVSEMKGIISEY